MVIKDIKLLICTDDDGSEITVELEPSSGERSPLRGIFG
jgi:hypothetical protein